MMKRPVVIAGCGGGVVVALVAATTGNPAYGLLACITVAIVGGLAIGIYSATNS